MISRGLRTLLAVLIVLAVAPARAFWWGPSYKSLWLDRTISIDGNADDWRAQEQDDAEGLSFAFANDDKNLYVLVVPHTKLMKAQMAGSYGQDFVIWLDPKAGKDKLIGIKLHAPSPDAQRDVEVLADTAAVPAMPVGDGAEVRMGPADERGVLEGRIPLRLLGTNPPQKISVGFETSRPEKWPGRIEKSASAAGREKDQDPGTEAGMEPGGGGMRRHRQGGGGHARRPSGPAGEDFSPIELWIRVTLAKLGK